MVCNRERGFFDRNHQASVEMLKKHGFKPAYKETDGAIHGQNGVTIYLNLHLNYSNNINLCFW
jgi:hypothetical protein